MTRRESYLGLDPGLGKTAVAAAIAKFSGKRITYICPPFLFANVLAEFERWDAQHLIYLFPDSMIADDDERALIFHLMNTGWTDTLVVDEAHRFKTLTAQRTKSMFGEVFKPGLIRPDVLLERIVMMSGTPMPNRPIELFPVLKNVAPWTIDDMTYRQYAARFCRAHERFGRFDVSGSSNMAELGRRVKANYNGHPAFMLRMRKKDVLKDLPPKIEETFTLSGTMKPELRQMDAGLADKYSKAGDDMSRQLGAEHVATYRRLLGSAKVPYAVEYISALLNDTAENILVFGQHTDVIAALERDLAGHRPLVVTGQTPVGHRLAIVNEFQAGNTRLLIGNYQALGTGFAITRADRVIFVEFSWAPGENDQASDRPHRIGRTEPVLVQYLVFRLSIDQKIIETLLQKRSAMQHV